MKRKHLLRLIELEESVLLAQVKNILLTISYAFISHSIGKAERITAK